MYKSLLPAIVLALSLTSTGHATDGAQVDGATTTMKVEDAKAPSDNNLPTSGVDVDEVITNKKMRAESGSKSKWSIGMALAYSGGTIETPLNERRPNLTAGAGQTLVSNFGGTVGVGYKITSTDRLGLDVGVRWIAPLQANKPQGYNGTRVDASNPQIAYSKMYKMGDVQSVFQFGPTVYTQTNQRDFGYKYGLSVAQTNAYEFGHSGFTLGLWLAADYNFFDRNDVFARANSSDYDLAASPFMEYVINDTFNLRTVFNWAVWEHDRDQNPHQMLKNANQQSIGVGISVTRDIFLYPNLQFQPRDLTHVFRADTTNVALNANINVF